MQSEHYSLRNCFALSLLSLISIDFLLTFNSTWRSLSSRKRWTVQHSTKEKRTTRWHWSMHDLNSSYMNWEWSVTAGSMKAHFLLCLAAIKVWDCWSDDRDWTFNMYGRDVRAPNQQFSLNWLFVLITYCFFKTFYPQKYSSNSYLMFCIYALCIEKPLRGISRWLLEERNSIWILKRYCITVDGTDIWFFMR